MLMVKTAAVVALVLAALGGPAIYAYLRIGEVERAFDKPCVKVTELENDQADWIPAIPSMQKHSELLVSWAIAISGGIVALITIRTLHQFQTIRFLYLLLAPALSFIIGSIWAAVAFQSRASYLLLNRCADSEGTLNGLLLVQTDLFQYSLATLVIFALVCLIELILGTVRFGSDRS